jgi:hypothetical protein
VRIPSGRSGPLFYWYGKTIERDRIRQVAVTGHRKPWLSSSSECELKGGGKHSVLRVFIDKPGGITHGDCELVSEQLGTVLDVEDLIPFSYTLKSLHRVWIASWSRILTTLALKESWRRSRRGSAAEPEDLQRKIRGLPGGNILLELAKGGVMEIPLECSRSPAGV